LLAIRGTPDDPLLEQQLVARRIAPVAIERFDDNAIIRSLVLAGEGVAVVPRLTIDLATTALVAHSLHDIPRATSSPSLTADAPAFPLWTR
jgi:DNA-binding transcriptional LysR family regulator